jgi:catechol 2,3-dioxygenase-like lactoylglutathione lyase family enzyme
MDATECTLPGLHHVTAITADAQKNINFYCDVLALRLVKLTVNFDDPASYHLYYGDESGRPGTVLTFFAWPGAARGRIGPPQVSATAFSVSPDAMEYWAQRLATQGVESQLRGNRFGEPVLGFLDPDGMQLELIGTNLSTNSAARPWLAGSVPKSMVIGGIHSVTLSERKTAATSALLTDVMKYQSSGSEDNRLRYQAGTNDHGPGTIVDIVHTPDIRHGTLGAGVVHHVAFRTPDDAQQAAWRNTIAPHFPHVSPVMDRYYFHSIYFREPGGVLFEIATVHPGFTADQPVEELGKKLMLPPWLEKHRAEIEHAVPPIRLPQ